MERSVGIMIATLVSLTTLAVFGCTSDRQVDSEVAGKIAKGDYDGARQIAARYILADLDIYRASARMMFINAEESKAYLPQVSVVDGCTWARNGDSVLVEATVRNNGRKALRYFEASVSFLDDQRNVVDTARGLFAISVPPGAAQGFEIVRKNPASFRYVTARVDDIRVQ
jgi:hypothetical protein